MKISVKGGYTSTEVIVEAENVRIVEDISHSIYGKKEDGKTDYTKYLGTDIEDESLRQFTEVMEEITYYRNAPFDSSDLIKRLFEKLPADTRKNLLKELNDEYQDENTYTGEDVKVAFEDGKKYGDGELELDTKGRNTAFEVWHENKFGFEYE